MATGFAKSRLPIEGGSSHRTERAASALGRVAHLLARQVAREVIASGLGAEQDEEAQPATETQPSTRSAR